MKFSWICFLLILNFAFGFSKNHVSINSIDIGRKFRGGSNNEFKSAGDAVIDKVIENSNSKNIFAKALKAYSNQLIKRPYITKIISSAIVGGTGDLLIQLFSKGSVDFRRWIVFTTVAGFYIAPSIHVWFNWLGNLPIPPRYGKVNIALIQMVLDQTIGAVIINGGFFYAFELSQIIYPPYTSKTIDFLAAGTRSIQKNMWITLVANWYCWPGRK
jgi:hypothetical protein